VKNKYCCWIYYKRCSQSCQQLFCIFIDIICIFSDFDSKSSFSMYSLKALWYIGCGVFQGVLYIGLNVQRKAICHKGFKVSVHCTLILYKVKKNIDNNIYPAFKIPVYNAQFFGEGIENRVTAYIGGQCTKL
jgi:hypothetical protein